MEEGRILQASAFDLSDLLTASGAAMGTSNLRLRQANAPALLQTFNLSLVFSCAFAVGTDDSTVLFSEVSRPNAQMHALTGGRTGGGNVTVSATFIAAPSLVPTLPKGSVCDP